MGTGGRNVRMNRRQIESRRRKQQSKRIIHFARLVILAVIALCIRNLYAHMEEIQVKLETLQIQDSGTIQTSGGGITPENAEEVEYIGTLDTWEVSKPIERTEVEVLQWLGELGQVSPTIDEIYQNYSLYPKELLSALANNPEMAYFVSGYPDSDGVTGGMTATEKEQEFPLFLQWDPRWGMCPMGIAVSGWQAAVQRVFL